MFRKEIKLQLNTLRAIFFSKIQANLVASAALEDPLVVFFKGLLKKTTNKKSNYHISNKLQECAKFFLQIKKLGSCIDMLSTLTPESFDDTLEAMKKMSKFNV